MTPTKLLIGQAIVTIGIVFGALVTATKWAAMSLGYQPRLGAAWFAIGDIPVYPPWRLFQWSYAYEP